MASITQEQYDLMQNKVKKQTPQQRYQALGRLKSGVMNKLETKYSEHLESLKIAGEILWWKFDCINLRLADNTHYRPDFLVLTKSFALECHETKGYWTDDAKVKIKVATSIYPFAFKAIQLLKGEWNVTNF